MADWQKGDLALCVANTHPAFSYPSKRLRKGAIHTVVRVAWGRTGNHEEIALDFDDLRSRPGKAGFPASCFIKVTPPSDMKAEPRAKAKPEQVAG